MIHTTMQGRIHRRIRFAQSRDDAVPAPLGRTQVNEQNLILRMMDNPANSPEAAPDRRAVN